MCFAKELTGRLPVVFYVLRISLSVKEFRDMIRGENVALVRFVELVALLGSTLVVDGLFICYCVLLLLGSALCLAITDLSQGLSSTWRIVIDRRTGGVKSQVLIAPILFLQNVSTSKFGDRLCSLDSEVSIALFGRMKEPHQYISPSSSWKYVLVLEG